MEERKSSIAERKSRKLAERERCIVTAARDIAGREGWSAVTIRRLADEIEYSQPVIYSHFENRDAIVGAVAVEGFQEITEVLRKAKSGTTGSKALKNVAVAYLDFALSYPALYEAMFNLPTNLRFDDAETKPELRASFEALTAVVTPFYSDGVVATESFWAALHGLAELERSGRIRPSARTKRIGFLVRAVEVSSNAVENS